LTIRNGEPWSTRTQIELYRFENSVSYGAITLIVYRLDNEVDLHGFVGTVDRASMRELFKHLKTRNVTHINCLRNGVLRRYRIR